MSRKRLTTLAVLAATLLVTVLSASVFSMFLGASGIDIKLPAVLPTSDSIPGATLPDTTGAGFQMLDITPENVTAVLRTIRRPTEYSQHIVAEWYWDGQSVLVTHDWYAIDGVSRLDSRQSISSALPFEQNRLIATGAVYFWIDAKMPYTVMPGGMPEESWASLPTWETAAGLSRDNIVSAEYIVIGEEPCVHIVANELIYNSEYLISIKTGLLKMAFFADKNGTPACRFTAETPNLVRPDGSWFLLPDGSDPING